VRALDETGRRIVAYFGLVLWFFAIYLLRQHGWKPPFLASVWGGIFGAVSIVISLKIAAPGDRLKTPLLFLGLLLVPIAVGDFKFGFIRESVGVAWAALVLLVLFLHSLPSLGSLLVRAAAWLDWRTYTRNSNEAGSPMPAAEVAPAAPSPALDDLDVYDSPFVASHSGPPSVAQAVDTADEIEDAPVETKEELLERLDAMTGLDEVKRDVDRLIAFVEMQQKRVERGLKEAQATLHLVFEGNPGTGKTEVARLLGRLLHAIGVLERGHLVEAARSDLVAEHVGATALKTEAVIDRALDGVLLIDEAYALAPVLPGNDFGQEAIDTLLKRMEDDRSRLVVIITGYPKPLSRFLDSNEGLRSRFTRKITFRDYTTGELVEITDGMAEKDDYYLAPGSKAALGAIFDAARKTENFGNARYARNLIEAAMGSHAARLSQSSDELTQDDLTALLPDDFDAARERLASVASSHEGSNAADVFKSLGLA
jgi:AAA+ superfamily predicted ATPase